MLVYRSDERRVDARAEWLALRRRVEAVRASASSDEALSILIELGEIQSAVLDAIFPDVDGVDALATQLTGASAAAGRVFLTAWSDRGQIGQAVHDFRAAVRCVADQRLPSTVGRRVSEGYAFYALHPETYALAATRYCRATPAGNVVCIGIRSIGTSLSAVVAAAIAAAGRTVQIYSVRPRGHPFDRIVRLDQPLAAALRACDASTSFLIVDEGPGLSGSSFTGTARALRDFGIPPSRIAFMPSWNADGSTFRSPAARAIWLEHQKWIATPSDAGVGVETVARGEASIDWSAGAWRNHLLVGQAWPAAQPQHERVKRWLPEQNEIVRFAGLGHYGQERLVRARTLAAEGFGHEPISLEGGYLRMPFVSGNAYSPATADAALVDWLPRYLAFVVRAFPATDAVPADIIRIMIDTNLREAGIGGRVPRFPDVDVASREGATAIDGRMLAHEFIRTPTGPFKCDALDHSADHFFPGCQHIAWDVAAVETELDLDPSTTNSIVDAVVRESGDRGLRAVLPFFRLAYAAFQIGYTTMAVESLQDDGERQRFVRRRDVFLARARALVVG